MDPLAPKLRRTCVLEASEIIIIIKNNFTKWIALCSLIKYELKYF